MREIVNKGGCQYLPIAAVGISKDVGFNLRYTMEKAVSKEAAAPFMG